MRHVPIGTTPATIRRAMWFASALVSLAALPALLDRLLLLPRHVVLNPNEGWNAMHTAAWLGGRSLYLDPSGPVLNNYPPLSFAVVSLLGQLTGDLVIAGRILSLASLAAITGLCGLIARRLTGSSAAGVFSAALLLATFAIGFTSYVGMNDPQLFGHLLATTSLLLLVTRWTSDRALIGALVLMAMSGLVKHNLLALPIATLLTAFGDGHRRGVRTLRVGTVLATLILCGLFLLFGRYALTSLLAEREWSAFNLAKNLLRSLPILAVPLATAVAGWSLLDRRGPERLLLTYLAIAMLLGIHFSGGAGVTVNIFFDAAIAVCVVGAIVVHRGGAMIAAATPAVVAVMPVALTIGHLIQAPVATIDLKYDLIEGRAYSNERAALALVERIRAAPGPVACEALVLCYWAGKPFVLDFFNARQASLVGRARPGLVHLLESGAFELVQLYDRNPLARLTPPAPGERVALDKFYREVLKNDAGLILERR